MPTSVERRRPLLVETEGGKLRLDIRVLLAVLSRVRVGDRKVDLVLSGIVGLGYLLLEYGLCRFTACS